MGVRALWAPSVVRVDAVEPFDPKGGLHEWVRGPGLSQPGYWLPAGEEGLRLGGSQGVRFGPCEEEGARVREHFAFPEGKPKPEWPGPGDLASCLEYTDTLVGYLASSWVCSRPPCALLRNGLVIAALPLAFWWNKKRCCSCPACLQAEV